MCSQTDAAPGPPFARRSAHHAERDDGSGIHGAADGEDQFAQFWRSIGEGGEGKRRRQFEIRDPVDVIVEFGRRRGLLVDADRQRRDLVVNLDEALLADRLTIDADPFAYGLQVRARIAAAPQRVGP